MSYAPTSQQPKPCWCFCGDIRPILSHRIDDLSDFWSRLQESTGREKEARRAGGRAWRVLSSYHCSVTSVYSSIHPFLKIILGLNPKAEYI